MVSIVSGCINVIVFVSISVVRNSRIVVKCWERDIIFWSLSFGFGYVVDNLLIGDGIGYCW